MTRKQIEIIDMNSGEVRTYPTMRKALAGIFAGRVEGGKWCLNSKKPGNIPCIERHLAFMEPFLYIAYDTIPSVFTEEDIAHYTDIGF